MSEQLLSWVQTHPLVSVVIAICIIAVAIKHRYIVAFIVIAFAVLIIVPATLVFLILSMFLLLGIWFMGNITHIFLNVLTFALWIAGIVASVTYYRGVTLPVPIESIQTWIVGNIATYVGATIMITVITHIHSKVLRRYEKEVQNITRP